MEKTEEKKADKKECKKNPEWRGGGGAEAVYGLGFIGAAIYYISTAATFWTGVLGFLKAIVWPVFLVYEALKFLGA
jgi:hypothetical protein